MLVCTFTFLLVSNFIRVYFKMFSNIVGINNTLSLLLLFHKPVSISMNHISSKFKRPQTRKKGKTEREVGRVRGEGVGGERGSDQERERGGGGHFTCIYVFTGLLHRMEKESLPVTQEHQYIRNLCICSQTSSPRFLQTTK